MKTSPLFRSVLLALGCSLLVAPTQGAEGSPRLTEVQVRGSDLFLAWTDGRPSYQLQVRSSVSEPWVNLGAPTTEHSMVVPLTHSQAFYRVVADFTARYQVVFQATWSQLTHPADWPANAHWSGIVGGTHNDQVHFWREGETASEGIRLMAERGQQATLLAEIAPAIRNQTAHLSLAGGGISTSPGSVALNFPQPMRRDFPLVTLVSMIAPSPDWFVGVDSLSLLADGEWVPKLTVDVYGYDAGTDSGASFASPDKVTVPRGVVQRFTGFPAVNKGVVVPFGTFTFTRLD